MSHNLWRSNIINLQTENKTQWCPTKAHYNHVVDTWQDGFYLTWKFRTWTGTLCSMLCLFLSEGCVWFKVSRKILEKVNMGMWYFYVWCKFWKRIPKNTSYSYLSCFLFPWRKVDILYSHGKIEVIFCNNCLFPLPSTFLFYSYFFSIF